MEGVSLDLSLRTLGFKRRYEKDVFYGDLIPMADTTEKFNDIDPMGRFLTGSLKIEVSPGFNNQWLEASIASREADDSASVDLSVADARRLRDWLNTVLPESLSSGADRPSKGQLITPIV